MAGERGQEVPRLAEALELIDAWEREAEALRSEIRALLGDAAAAEAARPRFADLNRKLAAASRDLYRAEGRPGAPTERNLFAGSSYDFEGVSGSTLPGIRFALDRGEPEEAAREAEVYAAALRRRVETLQSIRRELRGIEAAPATP